MKVWDMFHVYYEIGRKYQNPEVLSCRYGSNLLPARLWRLLLYPSSIFLSSEDSRQGFCRASASIY